MRALLVANRDQAGEAKWTFRGSCIAGLATFRARGRPRNGAPVTPSRGLGDERPTVADRPRRPRSRAPRSRPRNGPGPPDLQSLRRIRRPSTNDAQRLWIDAELEAELIVVERDGDLARQALILQFRRQRLAGPPRVEPKSEHRGDPAIVRLADGLAQGELTRGQDFAKLGRGLRIDVVDERSPSIALGPERSPPR